MRIIPFDFELVSLPPKPSSSLLMTFLYRSLIGVSSWDSQYSHFESPLDYFFRFREIRPRSDVKRQLNN